jgi:hypothetical protein
MDGAGGGDRVGRLAPAVLLDGRWLPLASEGISTKGALWSITNVLAFLALIRFTIATWGLFKKAEW